MSSTIRTITPAELETYVRLDAYAFGYAASAEVIEYYRQFYQVDWMLAAFEDGRMVAHLVVFPWRMAINGGSVPVGAIADVAAWPEDRRAGHTGGLLRACLGRMRDQGLALSMLYPTFQALYRRFGWAAASETRAYSFRASDIRFLPTLPPPSGRVERPREHDRGALAPIYDTILPVANGALVRDSIHWDARTFKRRGDAPLHALLWRDSDGAPGGYVIHHEPARLTGGLTSYGQEFAVRELVATSGAGYRALLEYLARHDLAERVTWSAPPDDPLPALLTDPAVIRIETRPGFMLRIVDLTAALEARPFLPAPPCRLIMRLSDPTAAWNEGTWEMVIEDGRARVRPSTAEPELSTDVATLAALWNGCIPPATAARTGLLVVHDHRALTTATAVFSVSSRPYCLDYF